MDGKLTTTHMYTPVGLPLSLAHGKGCLVTKRSTPKHVCSPTSNLLSCFGVDTWYTILRATTHTEHTPSLRHTQILLPRAIVGSYPDLQEEVGTWEYSVSKSREEIVERKHSPLYRSILPFTKRKREDAGVRGPSLGSKGRDGDESRLKKSRCNQSFV